MEHRLKRHALFLSAALVLASCVNEDQWSGKDGGKGTVNVDLNATGSLDNSIPQMRAVSEDIEVPDDDDFSIHLFKKDGKYDKEWTSYKTFTSEMEASDGIASGSYTIEAYYGEPEHQGYNRPYFYDTQDFTVLEGKETTVGVNPCLMNSLVEVSYTEAFCNYFPDRVTQLQSDGHDFVKLDDKDGGRVFVTPGEVKVMISATNQNGKTLSLNPATFVAEATHLYKVTYNVYEGKVGGASLSLTFDDNVEQKEVVVDLTDELYAGKAPEITCQGFDNGSEMEAQEGTSFDNEFKLGIVATGGIKSAVLTLESSDYTPTFGSSVDLCAANSAMQQTLTDAGITTLGLYKNPDKFASVDFTDFAKTLPTGSHKLLFSVTDMQDRVSDPVSVTLAIVPVEISAVAAAGIDFGDTYADIVVSYDGPDPKEAGNNLFSFWAQDDYNGQDCEIISIDGQAIARSSFESHDYVYRISIPVTRRSTQNIKMYFNGKVDSEGKEKQPVSVIALPVTLPDYSISVDAFAKSAVVRIDNVSATALAAIVAQKYVKIDGNAHTDYDASTGLLTFTGLNPDTDYTVSPIFTNGTEETSFHTEAATDIVNGDFSDVSSGSVKFDNIQLGGLYHVGALNYSVYTSILRDEPTGNWANINSKTAWSGATTLNTWFTVPSTWVEDGQAVVRTVGYNIDGTTPATSPGTSFNVSTTYYCTSVPTFGDDNKASGELFLGSYSFNGTETRVDGIPFGSRPSSVSFDYAYTSYNNEVGLATIEVLDSDGNQIAYGTLDLVDATSMTSETIQLSYVAFGNKAATLRIGFRSTKGNDISINIPTGSALNEGTGLPASRKATIDTNQYKTFASGSELTIDNVKLNY